MLPEAGGDAPTPVGSDYLLPHPWARRAGPWLQRATAKLAAYPAGHTAGAEDEAISLQCAIRLRITCHLADEEPPSECIVSARSVVWRGAEVLTVRNPEEWHVFPGGREREAKRRSRRFIERFWRRRA